MRPLLPLPSPMLSLLPDLKWLKYEAHKASMDSDMQTAWWALFASNERSAIKRIGKTRKVEA
jgi:hypothetical protein